MNPIPLTFLYLLNLNRKLYREEILTKTNWIITNANSLVILGHNCNFSTRFRVPGELSGYGPREWVI